MERTLRDLPRDRLLAVLERSLAERAGELPPDGLTVRRSGLTEGEASALLAASCRVQPGPSTPKPRQTTPCLGWRSAAERRPSGRRAEIGESCSRKNGRATRSPPGHGGAR
jgi:hypothetical protein